MQAGRIPSSLHRFERYRMNNKSVIPKKIHYCWFGGKPLPEPVKKCIRSWKTCLPDYEIKCWSESNFDMQAVPFVRQAYDARKWAFVSDYVRLHALYQEGGIYMDTDVEVVRNLDGFLDCSAFAGLENSRLISTCILGARKHSPWVKAFMDYYDGRNFVSVDGEYHTTPNTEILTAISGEMGFRPVNELQILKGDVRIYPKDYFCPLSYISKEKSFTDRTHAIHHFAGSWLPLHVRLRHKSRKLLSYLPFKKAE